MKRWDWVPAAAVVAVALVSLLVLVRAASRDVAARWLALRRRPAWVRALLAVALAWLALRVARLGWRSLLAFVAVVAGLALWGEAAARREAARSRSRTS